MTWESIEGPLHTGGRPKEDPGSRLRPSQALAIVAIWGKNQQMESLSLNSFKNK